MGRQNDTTSKRQQAFAILDENSHLSRADANNLIVEKLGIKKDYANTLFQTHRTARGRDKNPNSVYETIYKIKDLNSNRQVPPYISKLVKVDPDDDAHRSIEAAVNAYIAENNAKNEMAMSLLRG